MDPCGLKFQVIQTNGSRVIAVRSWAEKIGDFCLLYLQGKIYEQPGYLRGRVYRGIYHQPDWVDDRFISTPG